MQSAVIARVIPSVRPSVRHVPVLCEEYEFQANEDTIVRFSATGRIMPSSFWSGKVYPDHSQRGH